MGEKKRGELEKQPAIESQKTPRGWDQPSGFPRPLVIGESTTIAATSLEHQSFCSHTL